MILLKLEAKIREGVKNLVVAIFGKDANGSQNFSNDIPEFVAAGVDGEGDALNNSGVL